MKYLGIDYGKKKVGLAISEGEIASPLKIIEVSSLVDALQKVEQVIRDEKIDKVVLGLPESGEAAAAVRKFAQELKKNIEVIYADETLSSQSALDTMIDLGIPKKERSKEDAYSASLILQNFLDSIR